MFTILALKLKWNYQLWWDLSDFYQIRRNHDKVSQKNFFNRSILLNLVSR